MKKILLATISLAVLFAPMLQISAGTVYAETAQDQVKAGLDGVNSGGLTVDKAITAGVNIFSVIIGVAAVLMIMIGGLKYITANGESGQLSSARSTILYAIVGLTIVAMSQFIVAFTLHRVTALPPCPAGQKQISKPGDCTP